MAWLSDWSKRIKLTIDNTNVDDTLSNFPVLIKISDSSGISSTDVSAVFTELGSDANRKKIAVTTDDEETQCYVEIEHFDYANSLAWLWVKVPSVASGADTILYLYYDVNHADNDSYVGDTTDAVTHNVWDANFKLVMHMAQDPNGDAANAIKDSTSNQNDGTPIGSMVTADLVDGKIGKGIEFNGTSQGIGLGDTFDSILAGSAAQVTIESLVKSNVDDAAGTFFSKYDSASNNRGLIFRFLVSTFYRAGLLYEDKGVGNARSLRGDTTLQAATWYSAVGRYDATQGSANNGIDRVNLFINEGAAESLSILYENGVVSDIEDNAAHAGIGAFLNISGGYGGGGFDGSICETRISDILRSVAWIKATYYSNWDELVSFGSEQGIPAHYYYGYITENDVPISRIVRLYNRDTGELISATTSSGVSGYYNLSTTTNDEHFIVAFDDEAGEDYNALILDRLLPNGEE